MPDVNVTVTNSATIRATITGGGGTGGGVGSGTVTSVGLALPTDVFNVAGSPVTTSGTLTATLDTQTANTIWAGPTTGAAAAPTFRALVAGDIPTLPQSQITNLTTDLAAKQPLDSDLTAIAGLTATNDDFIQRKAGAWTNRTIAQVKTDLGLTGTNSGDQTITLTGDATGTGTGSFAVSVVKLQGRSVASTAPTDLQVLSWNDSGSQWEPRTVSGGGGGTVTSVALSLPAIFSVSGSPVTSSGTLTGTLATQTANTIWAGPTTGAAAAPTFRALVSDDIPTLAQSKITNLTTDLAAKQPLDSDLTAIAGLTATNDDFIQRKAGAWANRTIAQVKTDLGLSGTNSGDQTITLTGDATGTGTGSFAVSVVKLQGRSVASTAPTDLQVLSWNDSGSQWEPRTVSGGGGGTVTSVALSLPAIFSVSGSPVTSSGTLTGTLATQTANTIWAGPTNGVAAAPTFRALVSDDIPTLAQSKITSLTSDLAGKQPLDTDLTTISGLTPTNDDLLQYKAGAWANRTIAQVKTDLGLTGTNSGDQTITLTGDVTGTGTGSFAATIAANAVSNAKFRASAGLSVVGNATNISANVADITAANDGEVLRRSGTALGFGTIATAGIANSAVTYAKIQNVSATDRLLGRSTAGAGVIEEITCTPAGRALLDDVDAAAQRTTLGLGTLATQSGTFSGTSSGTNTGDQTITLTGDVTGTGTGSFAATIAANAVSNAKFRASAGLSVVGNSTNISANVADITAANDGEVLRRSGTALGFGTIATAGIANSAVTYSKIQNVSATDRLLGRSTAGAGVIEEITCTAAGRALLDDADAATQRTTLGLGTLATQSGTFSGTSSGTNTGDQTITLTGDVTGTGTGSFAATIANDAVTFAKMQNINTAKLLGRFSASSGNVEEITISTGLSLDGSGNLTASGGGSTDLAFSGTSSPVTLTSSSGTDVTITAGSGISLSATGTDLTITATGGGGGAPTNAQYLTLATDATLSAERVFAAGANVTTTDGGAGGNYTVAALAGVESPSQYTADQDNLSPTNWATKTTFRINGDTSIRAITGLDATGITDGTIRRFINDGTAPLYFPPEHPDSTAANRIIGDCDHILAGNGGVIEFMYDATDSRWRVLRNTYNPAIPCINGARGHYYNCSVGATTGADWGTIGFTGTNATNAGTSTLPGNWEITTGTTTTGNATLYLSKTVLNPTAFGSAHIVASTLLFMPVLSDGTNTYTTQFGLIPSPTSTTLAVNNSVGIRYSHGTNSGKWQGFSRDSGGTESTVDLGITVAVDTPYALTICIDKSRTEVRFFIDGVFCGRVTGNMPNAVGTGSRIIQIKSAGTTARVLRVSTYSMFTIYS